MYDKDIDLTGDGAAYVRTSDDQQETQRQYTSLDEFLKRHGATVPKSRWFVDEGWARDTADRRPSFQEMIRLAEHGRLKWIAVDKLDRFGWKSTKQLFGYLSRLEEAGCRLYDAKGKEWTAEDDATEITAWAEGKKSVKEVRELSYRVIGGMVEQARNGEWLGGAVRLGFDVACLDRRTERELWRVVLEGKFKRLKVYPDGRTERFDGKNNFPAHQEDYEKLQLLPSRDNAKVQAAVSVFERFATESISFTALAHYVNALGMRSCYGQPFASARIEEMLSDPIYMGYAAWNKQHRGKFHRHKDGQAVPELNLANKLTKNAAKDWIQSRRLFDPLLPLATWNAVQDKLASLSKRPQAPRTERNYLMGLMYCANCGEKMVTGRPYGDRREYICSGYQYQSRYKDAKTLPCKCLRNGVYQDEIERFVDRYLDETGKRLEILTSSIDADHLTDRLEGVAFDHWAEFALGFERLQAYLHKHHPEELSEVYQYNHGEDATEYEYIQGCIDLYQKRFDPSAVEKEISQLEAEHDALMKQWADLPTARAKEKAKARFAELEARIDALRQQQEDAATVVEENYREMMDLQEAIDKAKAAMTAENSERSLRQRSEAIRKVIQRIECTFIATKKEWRKKGYRLAKVTIYPLVGEPLELRAKMVLQQTHGSASM